MDTGPVRSRRGVPRRRHASALALSLLAAGLGHAPSAMGGDRPFLVLSSAAADEDDGGAWSVETVWTSGRGERSQGLGAGYSVSPMWSFQFEVGRQRGAGQPASLEAGVEGKWLYNVLALDGWAWGLVVGAGFSRGSGESWRGGGGSVVVPVSFALGPEGALLHLNAGMARADGHHRRRLGVGVEARLVPQLDGILEYGAEGRDRWRHGGLRWWWPGDRFAIDLSRYARREGGDTARGWVLGLNVSGL